VFARTARAMICLLLVIIVSAMIGGVLPAFRGQSPPLWLLIALLIMPWPLAVMLYIAMVRRAPARICLREDVIQTGGWLTGRDTPYEGIRMLKVERPEKTVGNQGLLTLQVPDKSLVKIWLKSAEALECFDALRSLCPHAPAIGLSGETYEPLDASHADAGRRTLADEYRRRAVWAMGTAVVMGALAPLHLAAIVFGWSAGLGRSPPVTRTIILAGVSIGALVSSLEQRRRARAIEATAAPKPGVASRHS
jgi:hypothetical protein